MGTAVLHPRDCLAPYSQQGRRSDPRHGPIVSDCPPASSFRIADGNRGLLGQKEGTSSVGLLPLPDHVHAGSASRSLVHRSVSRSSPNSSRGSLPFSHNTFRMAASSDGRAATPLMHKWYTQHHNVPLQEHQKLKLDSHFGRWNAKQSSKYVANAQRQSTRITLSPKHGGGKQPPSGFPSEKIKACDSQDRQRSSDAKQESPASCAPITKNCCTASNTRKHGCNFRVEEVLGCPEPVSDISTWLAMVDERWAGPSFFKSPPPSSLPVPSFTLKLARTTSTCRELGEKADHFTALQLQEGPPLEAKRTWDVAFATRDLRKLLHLDHA